MKPRNGAIVALLFLATCNEEIQKDDSSEVESAKAALGVVPPSEVAVWQKVGSSSTPDGRYLQAVAFDETRKVLVMFGGVTIDSNMGTISPNKETWEWSPATGKWTNRTGTGDVPDARSGAAMVFDSLRGKFVLFGGRSGGGYNYEDTWEWDPTTGAWTDVSAAGGHPTARSQHGMVYEKSTGKILLFGGGRSDSASYDATGVTASFGDTWEYDPATYVWTELTVATAPTVRHDFGMVWDSSRSKAVLFAGIQLDVTGAAGVPKQDTWEWDPAAGTWTERTAKGSKPAQRYAHAMAFDATRNKVVVFGGWDINTGGSRNDLWDWDPTTGVWTQRLTGSESGAPTGRTYASMVADSATARLELVAGQVAYNPYGGGGYYGSGGSAYYGTGGWYGGYGGSLILPPVPPGIPVPGYGGTSACEVWELNPTTPAFTNRTPPLDVPVSRYGQAMAYNPSTGKTYIFGGYDSARGQTLDDLWEWDGKAWAQVAADVRPPARSDAGLAYDPARKSLILFGGANYDVSTTYGDTWEWNSKWTQLKVLSSPDSLSGHGMVTDTTRNKILLFGGSGDQYSYPFYSSMRNQVWEWDGGTMTWTNRTPIATSNVPSERQYPVLAYDEGRQKMFLYDGGSYGPSASAFWEWDPVSAGWTMRDTGDQLQYVQNGSVAYDSLRRREVMLAAYFMMSGSGQQTWEIDAKVPTLYVRSLSVSPGANYGAPTMVFDKGRGVVVLFSGQSTTIQGGGGETWEYKVTNLGNGEGCTAASALSCATGFCVDGVCCDVAACTGACKSCNVAGYEGTCTSAKAGTEVAGSCSTGQACDGSGNCMSKNGQTCTSASACASGYCADGVCCDSACTGTCKSCKQVGQVGKCSPYAAGTDPQNECGKGTGVCKASCDGVGDCAYPSYTVSCGNCLTCDGYGTCTNYDYNCYNWGTGGSYYPWGGAGGSSYPYGTGGSYYPYGSGGSSYPYGSGGSSYPYGTGGSSYPYGSGGSSYPYGSGGSSYPWGGTSGPSSNTGGSSGTGTGGGVNLHKSGCSCELGRTELAGSGLTSPLLIAGVALLLVRKRRRKG
jgi:hypothetical protein